MINNNKNKSGIKAKSRILIWGLMLVVAIGVGFFGLAGKVNAAKQCYDAKGNIVKLPPAMNNENFCTKQSDNTATGDVWSETPPASNTPMPVQGGTAPPSQQTAKPASDKDNPFETELKKNQCGFGVWGFGGTIYPGCFIQLAYGLFYVIPSWLLYVSAYFFNVLINITLSSRLFKLGFISNAWGIVRDLSNMFFILILLYIAIKIILDIGGSEAKKIIAKVIIIALLINFSMFFTEVIIDSSNILALIFYDKVSVNNIDGKERDYQKTGYSEKDVAGGLVNAFNPTLLISKEYLDDARAQTITVSGSETTNTDGKVAPGILIGMLIIAGGLMFFAAYCLIIVGLSFLGRLIELFILIIFSPFALMSSTVSILSNIEYLGWDFWFKRLIKVAFMAPIFMFLLYFIFMLINADIFGGLKTASRGRMIESLLMIILPALLILIVLLKATQFAKKGSGEIGEAVFKAAKIAGGVGLAAATGGMSIAGTRLIGGVGGYAANKSASIANRIGDTKWGRRLGANKVASGLTGLGALAQRSSFDVRGIKIGGQSLASATGLKIGEAKKGGIEQRRKERVEKEMKRADSLKVRGDEKVSQDLKKAEIGLQVMLNKVAGDFHTIDEELKDLRQKKSDTTDINQKQEITDQINALNAVKKDIKTGKETTYKIGDTTRTVTPQTIKVGGQEHTIASLGSSNNGLITVLKNKREAESRRRTTAYANRISNWRHWGTVAKEAKHKIIMESKLPESATKT